MKKYLFLLFAFSLPFSLAQANDAELYDPAPPPDSAFVRVLYANTSGEPLRATVGNVSFGDTSYPALTNYRVVEQGEHKVTFEAQTAMATISAGGYYTIAQDSAKKIHVIEDELLGNPSKAKIYLYNISDAANASIFAPDHKAPIIDSLAANQGKSRDMNALTLKLQVKADDIVVEEFAEVSLKRRAGTSFALVGKAGNYKALMVENIVDR